MTIGHDNVTRAGSSGFTHPGVGMATTRSCMPGNHWPSHTAGGSYVRHLGARVWMCAACNESCKNERTAA